MNHYIKIFFCFFLANYFFLYGYDNYYLEGVESDYLVNSRNELRSYALDLKNELSMGNGNNEMIVNQWTNNNNIPTQIMEFVVTVGEPGEIAELTNFDYQIDLDSVMGPIAQVSIGETKVVEIGPIEPFDTKSTTLQLRFIVLSFLINALVAYLLFYLFKKRTRKIEELLSDIAERKPISHEQLGEQDVLLTICSKQLELDGYINQIEDHNFQVSNDQRDLMHAVAHELRSPIARFSFALELMEDSTKSDEEKKLVDEMQSSVDELEALIKEILSYSRLSYGKMILEVESVDIVETINLSIARLKPLYPRGEFCHDHQENEIVIRVDGRLIERAVVNLLRNAARFAKSVVKVECVREADHVIISIEDDGIGIPPGKRERIFEAFTRLDPSRSRDSGGVGLGLAIVKKIIEKHSGKISVSDSNLGGAQFVLRLPLVEVIED